jgi:hypothetical protein
MAHAIAFQVHQFAARRVGTNLETQDAAAELGLQVEGAESRRLARIAPDSHLHAVLGGRAQPFDDGAVGQHTTRRIDLLRGLVDQCYVDLFEVLAGSVVDFSSRSGRAGRLGGPGAALERRAELNGISID